MNLTSNEETKIHYIGESNTGKQISTKELGIRKRHGIILGGIPT